jgi:two-component system, OmpR family, phosphate regulon sensor histidine kinase PhoR
MRLYCMNKTFKRLGNVLLVALVVATLFYTIFRINEPSADETVIKETYDNQLDAILFSLNQYSEDVVSKWKSYVDMYTSTGVDFEKLANILNSSAPIKYIFFTDSSYQEINISTINSVEQQSGAHPTVLQKEINTLLQQHNKEIERLFTYRANGYRKLEPFEIKGMDGNLTAMIFLLNPEVEKYQICGFIIDPEVFAQEILAPRMQTVAQEEFVINISDQKTKRQIYSTEGDSVMTDIELRKRELWLLPHYSLGISLKGLSIETLAQERFNTYLYIILGLNAILMIGVFFAYRNIKKEVRLAKIKSDFVSNVSHEIRTPLALISMFAETLQMGRVTSEDKQQEYYTIISQEANRLAGIVNKILNFSQIEAGKRNFTFEKISLNEVVAEVMRSYEFHLNNQGFTYTFNPGHDLLPIHGDKEAITEAIINLLDNAVKYSHHRKEIVVRTGMKEGQTFVEITDKGVGISLKEQKAIFDKFYRVTNGEVHNVKGTGLGLALVKHIVEAHKGKIELLSAEGVGSTFRLSFPGKYNVSKLIAQ